MAEEMVKPSVAMRRLITGFRVSQAIHVATRLGIADLLTEGARSSDDLAAATETDPDALYRLLRTLAAAGVFHEDANRTFSLTELGNCLRSDAPESLAGLASMVCQPYGWQAWSELGYSIKTGQNAFRHVHGVDLWTYLKEHPEESEPFNRAMTDLSRIAAVEVVSAYDFGRFARIADIAGGRGAFLAAILKRWPQSHGVLFDQPHVVSGAQETFDAARVSDRVDIVAGDFFKSVPAADAYVLKLIIHDWEDAESIRILASCKAASPQASILIVEDIVGPPNETLDAKLFDLNMLVTPGGRERTSEEYAALFAAAGYLFNGVTPTAIGIGVFEGVPA